MTSRRYSLSHGTAQPTLLDLIVSLLAFSSPSLVSSHVFSGKLSLSLPLSLPSTACAGCSVSLPSPQEPWLHIWKATFFTFGQPANFIILLLHAQAGTPCFSQAVPLPTKYHLKSLGYIQICAQGSSLIFHLYLQTWRELFYRDTETPAYSIPSTYPYCLLGHISCFLPYISTLKSSGRTQTLCSDVWITSIHSLGGRTGCFSATEKYNVYLWQTFFFPYVPHKYLGSSSDPCSWGFPAAQNCGWHVTRQRCKSSCQLQKFSRSRGLAKSTLPGGSWVLWLSEARAALHFVVASRCRRVCVYLLSPIQGFRD